MKKYVISVKQKEFYNAGFKAKIDVDTILEEEGFEVKYLLINNPKNMKDRIKNANMAYKQLKQILKELKKDSILVFQYPIDLITYKFGKRIKKCSKEKNIKTICLIHDISALHHLNVLADLYYRKLKRETKFFKQFDFLISHNKSMTKYLNGCGLYNITNLEIFDYIIEKTPEIDFTKKNKVIIAGNLAKWKSGYIYLLNSLKTNNYNFELFGTEYENKSTKFIKYNGSIDSKKLPLHINYGFGLIWDGQCIDQIKGPFGQYLKYNNPHKFSLYIATGIPVIVWENSALSSFVKKNKIGYTINSLYELKEIFDKLTTEEYIKLQNNVKKIQKKVINGQYLTKAINSIINKIQT